MAWEKGECPVQHSQRWHELGDEQRRAASELGYDRRLWDAEDRTSTRKKRKTSPKDYPAFDSHVAV